MTEAGGLLRAARLTKWIWVDGLDHVTMKIEFSAAIESSMRDEMVTSDFVG